MTATTSSIPDKITDEQNRDKPMKEWAASKMDGQKDPTEV
jgi:hypothetical protein